MNLERAQLGLLAALAATIPVSIFASQLLLWLSIGVLVARLAARRARLVRTPLDTPLLALVVWTLLAASFAQDPVLSHEDSKKLLLFALFYVGVEALGRPDGRERVLSSALLGGLALAGLMVAQHLFLGYDRLDRRPSGFLGHYMSASGVTMAVLLLAVARLALGPRARPRLADLRLPAVGARRGGGGRGGDPGGAGRRRDAAVRGRARGARRRRWRSRAGRRRGPRRPRCRWSPRRCAPGRSSCRRPAAPGSARRWDWP